VTEESKLEAPTKELMELIFSDIMFQQAMQVSSHCSTVCLYCETLLALLLLHSSLRVLMLAAC